MFYGLLHNWIETVYQIRKFRITFAFYSPCPQIWSFVFKNFFMNASICYGLRCNLFCRQRRWGGRGVSERPDLNSVPLRVEADHFRNWWRWKVGCDRATCRPRRNGPERQIKRMITWVTDAKYTSVQGFPLILEAKVNHAWKIIRWNRDQPFRGVFLRNRNHGNIC
jgi:hypothetical protein